MKLYVAGSSQHIPEVRDVMTAVTLAGHTLTLDWTKDFDPDAERLDPRTYAMRDAQAVQDCDALVLVATPTVSAGAWWETGYAYAIHKPIFVLIPEDDPQKIFLYMPKVEFCRHIEALLYRLEWWIVERIVPNRLDQQHHGFCGRPSRRPSCL